MKDSDKKPGKGKPHGSSRRRSENASSRGKKRKPPEGVNVWLNAKKKPNKKRTSENENEGRAGQKKSSGWKSNADRSSTEKDYPNKRNSSKGRAGKYSAGKRSTGEYGSENKYRAGKKHSAGKKYSAGKERTEEYGAERKSSDNKYRAGKSFLDKPYSRDEKREKKSRGRKPGFKSGKGGLKLQDFGKPRPEATGPIRLNKYIAQAGICARRKADELIKEGRVKVNGKVVVEMGVKVNPGDEVEVNGNVVRPANFDYILLNKPTDVITSNQDEKDRKIVLDLIEHEELKTKGLFPVGRLDRNTVGALLITNDGELAHRLMHPGYEIQKLYLVRTKSKVTAHDIELLRAGVEINGEMYTMDKVGYVDDSNHRELGVQLHEGKNRHIRRMMEAIGHKISHLERVKYAGLGTDGIRRGRWRRLHSAEIRRLKRLVKLK